MDQSELRAASIITPVETFRRLLRALYPQRPELADEIIQVRWFHYPRHNGVPDEEHTAACAALAKLNEERRAGRIHLRGCLNGAPPADIDPIDATSPPPIGDFKVFGGALEEGGILEIYHRGVPPRIYRQVHCIEDDVGNLVREILASQTLQQAQPPVLKAKLQEDYLRHVEANKAQRPWTTVKQDEKCGDSQPISRDRLRELRGESQRLRLTESEYKRARSGGVTARKN